MMKKNEAADGRSRNLFFNLTIVMMFICLMLFIIMYLNDGTTDNRRQALESLAERFSTNVSNSHWQWQGEGRPPIIMLVIYANKPGEKGSLVETERRPIFMNHLGWPKADPTSEGCAEIWNMLLNVPMEIDGFKIFAEYYDGLKLTNNAVDSVCRYRLSTGAYFEYKVFSGQVLGVKTN